MVFENLTSLEKESLAIVVCLHGNEKIGLEFSKKIEGYSVFLGNPRALKEDKRFIESDMNRSFCFEDEDTYEKKRASELLNELKDFSYVLDIHSSTGNCPLCAIMTKPNKEKLEFVKKLGISRLVIMDKFSNGHSLIDSVDCGISLEIGPEGDVSLNELINFLSGKKFFSELEIYQVFDIFRGEVDKCFFKNFEEIKKGDLIAKGEQDYFADEEFIPVLGGEKAYEGVVCLKAKRIKESELFSNTNLY